MVLPSFFYNKEETYKGIGRGRKVTQLHEVQMLEGVNTVHYFHSPAPSIVLVARTL